jgi:NAD(P)-dependent dehydrogenase (short-subunit alcohol dehydrogenase family)
MTTTRVALVTGANRGIGLETVRQLARAGLLTVLGARDLAKGAAAAQVLKSEGLEVAVVALDVTSPASARDAVAEVTRLFGRLDILVNNAAILPDRPRALVGVETVGADVVLATFETNVFGPLYMTQAALPGMRRNRYGRIVNLSSELGHLAKMGRGWPAYRMSKAALNALTRTTAAEVAADGIKVNALCPGRVRTDMGGPDADRTPEQGADTVVWLAMLPDDGPTGGFFRDRAPIAW